MKKWLLIPLVLVILAFTVNAKCGDNFCDPGEDCTTCADDCLCTRTSHNELVNCTIGFASTECEGGYCKDRWCDTLEGLQSIFKKAICYDNGSVSLEINFQELDKITLTPVDDLKVYMKQGDEMFREIKGTWYNPSREGEFRYTKISETSYFTSDTDLFKTKGDYYVRVKYLIGRSNSLFKDTKISCPGIAQVVEEPAEEPVEEEPVEEVVEEPVEQPAEEPAGSVEEQVGEKPAEPAVEKGKTSYLWYIIIGIVILAVIIFIIKYETRAIRKI